MPSHEAKSYRLRMTGQKMAKIAYFIAYITQNTLRMPS